MEKRKILIVDDEEDLTLLLKRGLESTEKYEVREENAGRKAVAAAREFQPDLVLLDVMMPDMDGGEVAARFAKDEKLKNIPIVFLTAIVKQEEIKEQGKNIGGHRFLPKPIKLKELVACVDEVLEE